MRYIYNVIIGAIVIILLGGWGYAVLEGTKNITVHTSGTTTPAVVTAYEAVPRVRMLVGGDIMLDRAVRNRIAQYGGMYPFEKIVDFLHTFDVVVANLEGPFTDYPSVTADYSNKSLVFTFDPGLASVLKDAGFDVLGLANNHTLNFGREGLRQTHMYMDKAGLIRYGDPSNRDGISVIHEVNGVKIGFVGYHEFSGGRDNVIKEIVELRPRVDFLIVSPHWGEEYAKAPSDAQRALAQRFIESGADAVIGAHPHVVLPQELHQGKAIFYSLGNFVFDQDFSYETTHGQLVQIDIYDDKVVYTPHEIEVIKSKVALTATGTPVSFTLDR